jgi:hypothetical protein
MLESKFVWITPEGKGIIGSLDENGLLTFAVEAGPTSSIRGTELFDRMMRHFGHEVRTIQGVWRKGHHGRPSANIDKVNELTRQGVLLEDAILKAWTVTRAMKWGFNQVHVIGLTEGIPGAYTKIDVLIEKQKP